MKKEYIIPATKYLLVAADSAILQSSEWQSDDEEIVDGQGAKEGNAWEEHVSHSVWEE